MDIKTVIENSNLKIDKNKMLFNELMSKYTSFKIGGPAECLIKIDNLNDLKEIIEFANSNKIEPTILGNCSNVLISDKGIRGITIIIKLEHLEIEENLNNIYVNVQSGMKISKLGQLLLKKEITGFEELSGIPGTIGGAVIMNAGAHGKELKEIIEYVKCLDYLGNEKILFNQDLEFGYRTSILKNKKYIVTEAKLILKKGVYSEILSKMDEYKNFRKEKQPIEYPNAGSTFKRGENFITAKLIDEAGLKGYQIGDAQVSTKHAGFIINKGNATSDDVIKLVKYIKEKILEKFNKEIELEVEIIEK